MTIIGDIESVEVVLPDLVDSGTVILSQTAGFETETCGFLSYTQRNLHSWVTQDSSNKLVFTIKPAADGSNGGIHELRVDVAAEDYL